MALRFELFASSGAAADAVGLAGLQPALTGASGSLVMVPNPTGPAGQMVTLTSPGNTSASIITVYGTTPAPPGRVGIPQVISTFGPNNTTKNVGYFGTVTAITWSNGPLVSTISAGWAVGGGSHMWPVDVRAEMVEIGFGCRIVSGAPTFTVQHTFARLWPRDPGEIIDPSTFVWFPHADVAGDTANIDGNYDKPISALRIIATGTGSVLLEGYQAAGHD